MAAGFGNIAPFFTNYGPASATAPGFLTPSGGAGQQVGGNKEWVNAVAHQGTLAKWTPAAYLALTASTENTDINFNLARTVQFATGALTTQRAFRIQAPTYAFVGASTLTNAITLDVAPPVAGTNATISNPIAINATGRIESSSTLRTTGATAPAAGSGSGLEMSFASAIGSLVAYNRTAGAYVQLNLKGLTTVIHSSDTVGITVAAAVVTFALPTQLKTYTIGTLPASPAAGLTAFATDAGGNGPCIVMGNGSVWKRCDNASTTAA